VPSHFLTLSVTQMATDAESAVIDIKRILLDTEKTLVDANPETVEEDTQTAVVAIPVETRDRGGRKPKRYTTVTLLLLHCSYTVVTLHCCYTAVTLLIHHLSTVATIYLGPNRNQILAGSCGLEVHSHCSHYHVTTMILAYFIQGLSFMAHSPIPFMYCDPLPCCCTVVTLLPHCCYTVVTLLR
jgi:hypothetical protein